MHSSLKEMYQAMYRDFDLKKEVKGLLRIFSVLPYQSYGLEFAERFLSGVLGGDADMEATLKKLYASGWLEMHGNGYSMHPFIAECIQSRKVREKEIAPFRDALLQEWEKSEKGYRVRDAINIMAEWEKEWRNFDGELVGATELIPAIVPSLSDGCSAAMSELALMGYAMLYSHTGTSREGLENLVILRRKSRELSLDARVLLCLLLCGYGYKNQDELRSECNLLVEDPLTDAGEKALLLKDFAHACYNMGNLGETERMLEELQRLLETWQDFPERDSIRIAVCYLHAVISIQKGDHAGYGRWLLEGYETGRRTGYQKDFVWREIVTGLISFHLAMAHFEETEQLLQELAGEAGAQTDGYGEWLLLFYRGSLGMHRGDPDFGIGYLESACKLAKNLWYGIDDFQYAVCVTELAMAYNKALRREEAAECYKEAHAVYMSLPGHEFDRHRLLNNMGVMYLDWGKPQEALECLEEALPIARKLGGLGLAENENNLSKAWRQMGSREKELKYLKKAVPVLEQFYGGEHPKVLDAKERLGK